MIALNFETDSETDSTGHFMTATPIAPHEQRHDSAGPDGDGLGASAQQTPAFSPLYQQIKVLILQSLQAGEWKPSAAIPSEIELAARFKVSQGTVRKAIDELAAENLLVRRQGKGTFVATHAERTVQYRFLKLFPDNGDPNSEGPAQRHIIDCKRIRAHPPTWPARWPCARAIAVLQVRRVLSFAGMPTILEDLWLPATPFKGLTAERLADYNGPMYALFETEFGVHMVRAEEKIRAVLPDPEQCELLQIQSANTAAQRGAHRLHLQRRAHGDAPWPVPDRHTLLSKCAKLIQNTHASPMSACCSAIEFWAKVHR